MRNWRKSLALSLFSFLHSFPYFPSYFSLRGAAAAAARENDLFNEQEIYDPLAKFRWDFSQGLLTKSNSSPGSFLSPMLFMTKKKLATPGAKIGLQNTLSLYLATLATTAPKKLTFGNNETLFLSKLDRNSAECGFI